MLTTTIALMVGVAWADEPEVVTPFGGSATKPAPIINGEPASEDDYPMTGGMLADGDLPSPFGHVQTFVCSSTLIAPDVVLLAAHCIDGTAMSMGMGDWSDETFYWTREADLTEWDGTHQGPDLPEDAVAVRDRIYHDEWDYQALQTGLAENHDIALLFLEEAVTDVPFAYLPTAEEAAQIVADADVMVVGWGQQEATENWWEPPTPGTYAEKQQGASFIAEISDAEIKIGEVESDVRKCHGDSGGPTFLTVETESTAKERLVGVTSHAYDESDCDETGGVDTRVDHYLDWIDQQLRERCEDGSRAWCEEPGIPALPFPEPADTDDSDDGSDLEGEGSIACGCASPGGASVGLLPVVVGLLALRRRR